MLPLMASCLVPSYFLRARADTIKASHNAAMRHARAALATAATMRRRWRSADLSFQQPNMTARRRLKLSSRRSPSARRLPSRCSSALTRSPTPAKRNALSTGRSAGFGLADSTGSTMSPIMGSPRPLPAGAATTKWCTPPSRCAVDSEPQRIPQPAAAASAKSAHRRSESGSREVVVLDPSFSASRFCVTLGLPTALAEPMADAWSTAGPPPEAAQPASLAHDSRFE